jgi:hypothetical protein
MNPLHHTAALNHLYLVRCEPVSDPVAGEPVRRWRFTLVHIATGERRGFTDFDALVTFLREQLDVAA